MKLTPAQRRAVSEWKARTEPGRDYSISEVFSPRDVTAMRLRSTMHQLAARGMLKQGIPGGNPLKEAV